MPTRSGSLPSERSAASRSRRCCIISGNAFKIGVPPEARKHPAFPYYGSDIKLQTGYILQNLKRTFSAAGSSLEKVTKAQVFLTDLNDFAAFDEVWKEYFAVPPPRTTIETSGLLIKDAVIEIDLIGVR